MTSIQGFESEDIAKKCSVRFGVLAVDNYVRTRTHLLLLKVGSEFLAGYAELKPFGRHA
jgi:hypothetical protein